MAWRQIIFGMTLNIHMTTISTIPEQGSASFATTSTYQGSFRYNGAKTWNALPRGLRKMTNMNSFSKGLKNFYKN